MMINKYKQLKIAATVLNTTIKKMANELDISYRQLNDVANGNRTSERVEKYIDEKISEADKIIRQHKDNVGE